MNLSNMKYICENSLTVRPEFEAQDPCNGCQCYLRGNIADITLKIIYFIVRKHIFRIEVYQNKKN